MLRLACLILTALAVNPMVAETGHEAWLRYAAVDEAAARPYRDALPAVISSFGDGAPIGSARQELIRGVRGMLGRTLRMESGLPKESAILVGTIEDLRKAAPQLRLDATLGADAFLLKTVRAGAIRYIVIAGGNDRGALYGAFALLRKIATGEPIGELDAQQTPYAPVRWVNQWDNLDGTIERGYGGRTIFWEAATRGKT